MNTLLGFPEGGVPAFGRMLRDWRTSRRMSQLTLATEAGISTRHLSFLETGRAQPSREMVELLAGMLDVPLGERNALLVAAGYAPAYGERPLGAPELEPVRRALDTPAPAGTVPGARGRWPVEHRDEERRGGADLRLVLRADENLERHAQRLRSRRPARVDRQLVVDRRVPDAVAAP